MSQVPQKSLDRAIERFAEIWGQFWDDPGYIPSEFELRLFEREAQKALKNDPGQANALLGGVAVLRRDPKTMMRCYSQALHHDHTTGSNHYNYLAALSQFGAFPKGLALTKQLLALDNSNPLFLQGCLLTALGAGRFQESLRFGQQWQALNPDKSIHGIETHHEIIDFLTSHDITDQDVEHYLSPIFSLFWERGVLVFDVRPTLHFEENEGWVSLKYVLRATVEESVELGWEANNRLGLDERSEKIFRYVTPDFVGVVPDNGNNA
ncbi:MAG: hypothetical protein HQL52_07050 [Magnetococcales bacterium]|nr:hypothetical protein [Magnetococcales bacterium]